MPFADDFLLPDRAPPFGGPHAGARSKVSPLFPIAYASPKFSGGGVNLWAEDPRLFQLKRSQVTEAGGRKEILA